jgi:hypothetical protein
VLAKSRLQKTHNDVAGMLPAFAQPSFVTEILLKDYGQGEAIGDVDVTDGQDGYIQLDWIDISAEDADRLATVQ